MRPSPRRLPRLVYRPTRGTGKALGLSSQPAPAPGAPRLLGSVRIYRASIKRFKTADTDAHLLWLELRSLLSEPVESVAHGKKPRCSKEGIADYGQREAR